MILPRKILKKHWCIDDLLSLCPELLLRFYPDDMGCLYGMKKYVLLDAQESDCVEQDENYRLEIEQ